MLYFVIGGVRSGKSSYSEKLCESLKVDKKIYIATSVNIDLEMKSRIEKHKKQRDINWVTIEEPYNLENVTTKIVDTDVVLLDCLTVYVSNILFVSKEGIDCKKIVNDMLKINNKSKDLVIISNDIFSGYYQEYGDYTMTYIEHLGHLHQEISRIADVVIELRCGIPILLKGEIR